MKKSIALLFGAIALGILGFLVFNKTASQKPGEITTEKPSVTTSTVNMEKKASFAIFTNGLKRDFSDSRYHNQSEDVFIESNNPTTVFVKKNGISWDDFFKTLPMSLSKDCLITGTKQTFCIGTNGKLRFFLNGKENSDALSLVINDNDQLLVTFGNETTEQISTQLQELDSL